MDLGERVSKDFLTCPLCANRLRRPKVLPCLHSFCQDCLLSSMGRKDRAAACPICQKTWPSSIKTVQDFPNNYLASRLLDMADNIKPADEPVRCHGCKEYTAAFRCMQCSEYLCDECSEVHGNLKMTKDHQIMSIKEYIVTVENESVLRPDVCRKHDDTEVELFCETCTSVICKKCILGDHKYPQHKYIKLKEIANSKRSALRQQAEQTLGRIPELQESIDGINEVKRQLKTERDVAEMKIREKVLQLMNRIGDLKNSLLEDLQEKYQSKQTVLNDQRDALQQLIDHINSTFDFTENLAQYGSDNGVVSLYSEAKSRMHELSTQTMEYQPEENILLKFDASEKEVMPDIIGAIHTMGAVAFTTSLTLEEDSPEDTAFRRIGETQTAKMTTRDRHGQTVDKGRAKVTATIETPAGSLEKPMMSDNLDGTYTFKYCPINPGRYQMRAYLFDRPIKDEVFCIQAHLIEGLILTKGIRGSGPGDFCDPFGVSVTEKGDIIVADNGNNRVQVFNCEGHYKSCFSIDDSEKEFSPCDLAITRSNLVLVTDRSNRLVYKYQLEDKEQVIKRFGSHELKGPAGIAISQEGLVHVVDHDGHCVRIYTIDGKYVRHFGSRGKLPGQFDNPWYIAFNSRREIIVSDTRNHRVQIFSGDGVFQHSFGTIGQESGNLLGPTGVAVDSKDNIIVSDYYNNRIQVFNKDGQFLRRLDSIEDNICKPRGLFVTNDKPHKLIVADSGNNSFKIFQS